MGALYSCCLKALGYDNLDRNPPNPTRVKYQPSNISSDGRKYVKPPSEVFQRPVELEKVSSTSLPPPPPPPSDTGCGPPLRCSPTAHCPGAYDVPQMPPMCNMPRGFRDNGTRDRARLKLSLGENCKRFTAPSSYSASCNYHK